jgi:hypothetical protein
VTRHTWFFVSRARALSISKQSPKLLFLATREENKLSEDVFFLRRKCSFSVSKIEVKVSDASFLQVIFRFQFMEERGKNNH